MDLEDLVTLETEREGEVINQAAIGIPATWSARMHRPPTQAKLKASSSMVCCNNCPSKGCKECPMFGVGLNPVYMQRVEERDKKRRESGDLALEEFDRAAQEKLNVLFDPTAAPLQPVAKAAAKAEAEVEATAAGDDGYWQLPEDAEAVQVECPDYVFAGELLPFTTPDGEREEVRVPEWVERGSEFAVAMAADGEWRAWRPAPAPEPEPEPEPTTPKEKEEEEEGAVADAAAEAEVAVAEMAGAAVAETAAAEPEPEAAERGVQPAAMPELAMPSTRAIAEELSGLAGLGEGSAAGEAALAGRVVPTGVAASSSPAMDAPSGPADGLAAEPSDEIFAAIFAAPAFGDDDDDDAAPLGFGGNPLGEADLD